MKETIELKRDCEVIAIPSGTRQVLPQGSTVRVVQKRGGNYMVSSDIHAMYRIDAKDADALGFETPAAANEATHQGPFSEQLVWDTLKTVYDPEIPLNVVDLGLIYSCAITPHENGGNVITIRMAMTSPGCGMSNVLKADVESKLQRLPEVAEAHVEVVFDPRWNPSRMSEAARLQLGFDLETPASPRLTPIT
ncbi:MAG: putative Fe-S cluster assembly protein SufT [Terracidiphilus sp.]